MKCPRRDEVPMAGSRYPQDDYWRDDRTCSFCGSLEPDYALSIILDGAFIGTTDKNYKMYLAYKNNHHMKVYFQHFSTAHQMKFINMMNDKAHPLKFEQGFGFYTLPFFVRMEVNDAGSNS